ncbi:response regulator [Desertivirga xinjiangensis]|uniref:response regulator n=1 Tax=Desertivirga xinjiangensis TaxID=539206 RepID=UPI002108BEFC
MKRKQSWKAGYRLILIAVFTFAILILSLLAIRKKGVSEDLEKITDNLGRKSHLIDLTDASIEKLYTVENFLRLYTTTSEERYKSAYVSGLDELKAAFEVLEKEDKSSSPDHDDLNSLGKLLAEKRARTEIFARLKNINDSLILATVALNDTASTKSVGYTPYSLKDARQFVKQSRSVFPAEEKKKKGVFKRVADAIANKNTGETKIINVTETHNYELQLRATQRALNKLLRKSVERLAVNNRDLRNKELNLLSSNTELISRLSSILRELKKSQQITEEARIELLNVRADRTLQELTDITEWMIAIGFILASIILFNVWRLYQHDKELVEAKNAAIRQTHLKGDFLAHMSHEIRTPLNSILGFSEQLDRTFLTIEQKQQVAAIRNSSEVLLTVVNDILDLSKLETGKLVLENADFMLSATFESVVSSLKILAEKKSIRLDYQLDFKENLVVSGDEHRLKQVLINLVNNAIKFTAKGSVTLNARLSKGEILEFEVIDTGKGIAKQYLKGIFEEFTQVPGDSNKQNGTGLGLPICKKIVEAQNGTISVSSEVGKGSVFSVKIPFRISEIVTEPEVKEVRMDQDLSLLSSKRILIAEDDKMNVMLCKMIFKKWKVDLDIAENGNKAFEMFKDNRYDIILSDINMPELDGIRLTEKIRRHGDKTRSGIPILAITAHAMKKDHDQYLSAGMNDYVVKPFSEEELFQKIVKYIS